MFLASSAKPIDEHLHKLIAEIESQNSNISVIMARQFHYNLRQNIIELTVQEQRKFNVLEEFIIRAGIEFDPPPSGDELASVLGLDPIFVRSTISNLQKLQTLAAKSPITVTAEGRTFYEKGTMLQAPYSIQIYAVTDPLTEKITLQSQSANETPINQNDAAVFLKTDDKLSDISTLSLEELKQIIQRSDLEFDNSETGKIITAFRVLSPINNIGQNLSLFIIFDEINHKLSIEVRKNQQVLKLPSSILEFIAQQLWINAVKLRDSQLAIEPLCIWCVLGKEELALTTIQKNSWLELLPVWLNVVLQGLKRKSLSPISGTFKTAISLLNEISGEEIFVEPLKIAWRQVIGAIAVDNYETASNLLNTEAWAQFLRLDIAHNSDSPATFLSQHTTPPSQIQQKQAPKHKRK